MKLACIAAALLGLATCARMSPAYSVRSFDERDEVRAADRRSAVLEQEVLALTAGAAPPECRRVCELIEQICDLSERICLIAGRHRDDQELGDRCAAGEQRCRRSRDRGPPGCSCQPSR